MNGDCIAYEMGWALGADVHDALITFIWAADEGSKLTLRKTADGYQVRQEVLLGTTGASNAGRGVGNERSGRGDDY